MFSSGWLLVSSTLLEMILLWLQFFPCSIHHTITPESTPLPYLCCSFELVDICTVRVNFRLTFISPSISFLVFASSHLLTVGVEVYCCTRSHSDTHPVGLFWSRDRPETETSTWKHTTLTRDTHVPSGFRTHNRSKRSAADPRLRPRGHWIGLSLLTPSLARRSAMHFSDIHISHLLYTLNQLIVVQFLTIRNTKYWNKKNEVRNFFSEGIY